MKKWIYKYFDWDLTVRADLAIISISLSAYLIRWEVSYEKALGWIYIQAGPIELSINLNQ